MSSWQGNYDNAANAPYWAVNSAICKSDIAAEHSRPTAINVGYLYGNTTPSAYITDDTIGLFMVDATEEHAGSDNITDVSIISGGTQYAEIPTVSFSGGGGASAAATATISGGVVTKILITNTGSSYETVPTVAVTRPKITFDGYTNPNTTTNIISYTGHRFVTGDAVTYAPNGNGRIRGDLVTVNGSSSAVVNTTSNIITSTSHPYLTGDEVYYEKSGSNPITGLTTGTSYFIEKIDANRFALYNTYANSLVHDGTGLMILSGLGNGTTDTFKYIFNTNQTYYVIKITNDTIKLARTAALAAVPTPIDLTAVFAPGGSSTTLTLTSGAATAVAVKGLGEGGGTDSGWTHAPHTGWNLKTVGTGGRAGRVTFETLTVVADVKSDNNADDKQLPDA
jgi:hypothetical protein